MQYALISTNTTTVDICLLDKHSESLMLHSQYLRHDRSHRRDKEGSALIVDFSRFYYLTMKCSIDMPYLFNTSESTIYEMGFLCVT